MKNEYYNEYRSQVTDLVIRRQTLFTRTVKRAFELSTKYKTYYYEMFNQENEFIGYGVPRN